MSDTVAFELRIHLFHLSHPLRVREDRKGGRGGSEEDVAVHRSRLLTGHCLGRLRDALFHPHLSLITKIQTADSILLISKNLGRETKPDFHYIFSLFNRRPT